MDIEIIQSELKEILSTKRYRHSVGVMERAEELANIYNVDINAAKLVGIAHDIAKEMTSEEVFKYANNNKIVFDDIEKKQPSLLHSKIGADICKKKYNFTESMQEAIIYHTTGSENMDMLAKIIFIADATEKNRNFENLEYLVTLSNSNIDEAIVYYLDATIKGVINKKQLIHPNSVLTRNSFLDKINEYKKTHK